MGLRVRNFHSLFNQFSSLYSSGVTLRSEDKTHLESVVWLCAFDSLLVNACERLSQAVLLVYNANVVLFLCIHMKTTHATMV